MTVATLTRDMPDRTRIVATVAMQDLAPATQPPYFSVTCVIYYPHGTWSGAARQRNDLEPQGGGANHDAILRAFPDLAPLVALHLSSATDGTPMHALANARYFWRGQHLAYEETHYGAEYVARHGTGAQRAARTLRCDVADLPDPALTDDDGFAAFVDTLRPRWASEAAAGRAMIEQLRPGGAQ